MNKVNEGDNISAGVLIRESCTKVLEPIDIIPSKNNGSNTLKTKPGWCTVDLVNGTRSSQGIHCKQIAVNKGTPKMSEHSIFIPKLVLKRMCLGIAYKAVKPRIHRNWLH